MAKSTICRVGGKFSLAGKLISMFPEHVRYIEPFGGAMHVLFKKSPAEMDVYNDIDCGLVNFFQVVRDKPEELVAALDFYLYAREVFNRAKQGMNTGTDIERAARFFIVNRQCFGGKMETWGVRTRTIGGFTFFRYEKNIREAHERLKTVLIENLDFREIFRRYDSAGALFYCDPPYAFNEARSKRKAYDFEMTDEDYADLVEILKGIKGKFLLSGYANPMYNCFERRSVGESYMRVNMRKGGERIRKEEFVWGKW